jgi:hypothetical protein
MSRRHDELIKAFRQSGVKVEIHVTAKEALHDFIETWKLDAKEAVKAAIATTVRYAHRTHGGTRGCPSLKSPSSIALGHWRKSAMTDRRAAGIAARSSTIRPASP